MNYDLPELAPETPAGTRCQVKVSKLRPTQNAVGFDEVNDKIARYSAKSKEDLRDYLLVHPVPVVIGNLPEEQRKDIIDEAMHLARSTEAAGMPGYLGPS
jgi:hypothetical protein